MITRLEDPSALNAEVVGAKAAALALARRGDLPVLPGFVIDASASRGHLALGSSQLAVRGSGGARLTVSAEPIPGAEQIEAAGRGLSSLLVARSSSPMEGDGKWAGAFTSYIGITPEELPKAVAGCWASTFSVDALDRQRRAGIEPGSVPMAVLVQPAIDAVAGGVAEITPEGTVRVEAVAGTPAALLQGWERGAAATRRLGEKWEGAAAIALIGEETLHELGAAMDAASRRYGYDRCEWGIGKSLRIFQLGTVARRLLTDDVLLGRGPSRTGVGDPLAAAMVFKHGVKTRGLPAAPGVGVGVRYHYAGGEVPGRPGAVITAPSAFSSLSQMIWEAAGLVTDRGSPAAHVFEAARSLGVPAICGVDLGPGVDQIVAVDGYEGVVATLPLSDLQPSR